MSRFTKYRKKKSFAEDQISISVNSPLSESQERTNQNIQSFRNSFDDEKYDDYDENSDEEDFFDDEDLKEKSNQLAEKKKEYYVKAEDLINEIRKYQESKKNSPDGKGKISEELGLMIMKICTRFSMHPRFYRI